MLKAHFQDILKQLGKKHDAEKNELIKEFNVQVSQYLKQLQSYNIINERLRRTIESQNHQMSQSAKMYVYYFVFVILSVLFWFLFGSLLFCFCIILSLLFCLYF